MHAANILNLGLKELRGLARDPGMLALIAFAFTISIYTASTAMPEQLNKTPIAIVDEDRSPLSTRIMFSSRSCWRSSKRWRYCPIISRILLRIGLGSISTTL